MKRYNPKKTDFSAGLWVGGNWIFNGTVLIHVSRLTPANRLKLGRVPSKAGWDLERAQAWAGLKTPVAPIDAALLDAWLAEAKAQDKGPVTEWTRTGWRWCDWHHYVNQHGHSAWVGDFARGLLGDLAYGDSVLMDDETRPTIITAPGCPEPDYSALGGVNA